MKIHKLKSYEHKERKGDQQAWMVYDCIDYWYSLNNADYPDYTDIINMKTYRWNDEDKCYVAKTYHKNLNKW